MSFTIVIVLGALLAACGTSESVSSAPRWPGLPATASVYTGDGCRRILVVGDSIANGMAPFLESTLDDTGRCATVVDRSKDGTSVGDLRATIEPQLASADPDVVVIHHVGNEGATGPAWSDPDYLATATAAAIFVTDLARASGASVYWAVPPVGAWSCRWDSLAAQRWREWAAWLRDDLPHVRPVGTIDLRTPFGGEQFSDAFTISGEARRVRDPDCVHLTRAGSEIAATATALAIQHEWVEPDSP